MNNVIAVATKEKTFILKAEQYELCDTITQSKYGVVRVNYWGDVPVIMAYTFISAIPLSEDSVRAIAGQLDNNAHAMRSHTLMGAGFMHTLLNEPEFVTAHPVGIVEQVLSGELFHYQLAYYQSEVAN